MRLNDEKSIYLQIGQMIEDSILRGIFLEEERVPSTNELARLYSINPATAAKGVNLLVEQGILYKKRGIGMFVSRGAVEKIRETRKAGFYEQSDYRCKGSRHHKGGTGRNDPQGGKRPSDRERGSINDGHTKLSDL